jgi:protein-disulfide isomerase
VKKLFLSLMGTALIIPAAAHAEMSAEQKLEIEGLVREYILQHGEILIESVNNYQAKQEAEANKESEKKAKDLVESFKKDDKTLAMAGNPDGDVTVVEFFDFNCGYCKKAFEEVQSLLKDDKNVRIVFYDMPILGPNSLEMAKWALAAKKQGKYFDMHKALIQHQGDADEKTLKKLAKDAGLDAEQLAKDKDDPSIEAELKKHIETAQSLGIQGTPGFIIGDKIYRGYVPYSVMQDSIKEARKDKKS